MNFNFSRKDHELPPAIEKWGWKYHHMGIPTKEKQANEKHIPHLGMHVSGFPESPFGIEWMRFDKDSPIHPLIQEKPHLAFIVNDLDSELKKFEVLTPPGEPSDGVRVAMIKFQNLPVELMEFTKEYL